MAELMVEIITMVTAIKPKVEEGTGVTTARMEEETATLATAITAKCHNSNSNNNTPSSNSNTCVDSKCASLTPCPATKTPTSTPRGLRTKGTWGVTDRLPPKRA